jgi:hypothetical protein
MERAGAMEADKHGVDNVVILIIVIIVILTIVIIFCIVCIAALADDVSVVVCSLGGCASDALQSDAARHGRFLVRSRAHRILRRRRVATLLE